MSVEVKPMEIKGVKKPNQQTLSGGVSVSQQARAFVAEVKSEIGRVTWTSKEELLSYTKIVVLATLFFGMAIYFTDLFIQTVLNFLNFIFS